jgi:peptide/nickel transport system substrate-binding protein
MALEAAARQPLGWGPYLVEEWTPGDHLTLRRNLAYFAAGEELPRFDILVFRFVSGGEEALQALLVGECDYVDESAGLEGLEFSELLRLQAEQRISLYIETGAAWEHLTFGLAPLQGGSLVAQKEVRQAIAHCIDRPALVAALGLGEQPALDSYVQPDHPLHATGVRQYAYDPAAAADLLTGAGWVDADGDPATPRLAQGVPGQIDGTPLALTYLVSDERYALAAAQRVAESLTACGVQVNVQASQPGELLAPGPDGPVFGRHFTLAQFAWETTSVPACSLYTTAEIPGAYPDASRGWGGANAGGYSNPDFDQACLQARLSLPGAAEQAQAHQQAQEIFAEDLPALPLFFRIKVMAGRPDLCGLQVDASADSALWSLERLDYGPGCAP